MDYDGSVVMIDDMLCDHGTGMCLPNCERKSWRYI